jgi:hypothetical protein
MVPGFKLPPSSSTAAMLVLRCKLVLSVLFLVLLVSTRIGTSAQNQKDHESSGSESSSESSVSTVTFD